MPQKNFKNEHKKPSNPQKALSLIKKCFSKNLCCLCQYSRSEYTDLDS